MSAVGVARKFKAGRESSLQAAAYQATPTVERMEGRQLFCSLHAGVGDVFDPTARLLGVESPDYVARVNFGPTRTRDVPGYVKDAGDTYGAKAQGLEYGWTTGELNDGKVRQSKRSQDDRYDSFLTTPKTGATWELAVPNGHYTVRLAAGDARSNKGAFDFSVEGVSSISGTVSKQQRWLETTMTVAVTDGKLTVNAAPGERPGKINFIDVASADSQELSNAEPPQDETSAAGRATTGASFGLSGLTLVNAQTDRDLFLLTNGSTINLGSVGSQLNVRANPYGGVKSVKFVLDGSTTIESAVPFSMKGDNAGNYNSWTPTVGTHTLVVTPYSGTGATGTTGAATSITFTVTNTTPSQHGATTPGAFAPVKVNFQPAAAASVSGYAMDSGATYATRNGLTYGWSTSHANAVFDRNVNANQLLDTNVGVKAGARWELAVPNGQYTVKVGAGDSAASSKANVWVEGVQLYNYVSLGANQFRTNSITVNVSDGKLTIGVGSAATGTSRLAYVEVTSPTTVPPTSPPSSPPPTSPPTSPPPGTVPPTTGFNPVKFNFQPASAPTVGGYAVDSGNTYAARNGLTYGWSTSHVDTTVDRNINSDQLLDTNLAVKAGSRWELAVPNGKYVVKVGAGDAGTASRPNVWVEGTWFYQYVNLTANQFKSDSVTVNVTDGRLSLEFGQAATGTVRLTHLEVAAEGVVSPPTSPPPAFVPLKVNFQPNDATTAPGYTPDFGGLYGDHADRAYGWSISHEDAVYRWNLSSDPLDDTNVVVKPDAIWEAAVPTGQYLVSVRLGDPGVATSNNVWIEGTSLVTDVVLAANEFSTRTATVDVTDGKLTLSFGSAETMNTRVVLVEVKAPEPPLPPPPAALSDLTLINSTTDQTIGALTDGAVIDMRQVGARLNVEALPGTSVGSVVFTVDGKFIRTDSAAPFALGGDTGPGAYNDWIPTAGSHRLVATPYSGAGATGTAGTPISIDVTVTDLNGSSTPPAAFPTSVSWTTMTASPVGRAEAIGNVVNGKLYVFGGLDGTVVSGTQNTYIAMKRSDVFNPATNSWTRIADQPEPITHTTGIVVGNSIWFVGGYVGNQPTGGGHNKVYIYNTSNNAWTRGPNLPQAQGAGGAALIGSTIYFVGGTSADREVSVGNMYALDLNQQSDGWKVMPSMPTPRNHLAVATVGGKLYAVSGQLGQVATQEPLNLVHSYDPVTNAWTRVENIPYPRTHTTSAAFAYRGRIVIVGGENGYDANKIEMYTYDPAYDRWSVMGRLPAARSTIVSGLLPDGRIIGATGNSPGSSKTTWIGVPNFS